MSAKPFFLTGATAKLIINNHTLALAVDVSYQVATKNVSPRVLGRYEVEEHQPVAYDVTGSFTVIRYMRDAAKYTGNTPVGLTNDGNGIGSWGGKSSDNIGAALGLPSGGGSIDARINESFNPSLLHKSMMFDLEIRQKINSAGDEAVVARVRNCRIETSSFNLRKRGPALQAFTFKGQYLDEDSFVARQSGVGQEI